MSNSMPPGVTTTPYDDAYEEEMEDFSETIMPAGKFRGKIMADVPSSYLKWVAENWSDDDICEAADKEWSWRDEWKKHWEE